jgi:hypothetical protein
MGSFRIVGVGKQLGRIRGATVFWKLALIRNEIGRYKSIRPAIRDDGTRTGSGAARRPAGMHAEAAVTARAAQLHLGMEYT